MMLKRAIFALTGTYPAPADEAARDAAVENWHDLLPRWIANPLNPLDRHVRQGSAAPPRVAPPTLLRRFDKILSSCGAED